MFFLPRLEKFFAETFRDLDGTLESRVSFALSRDLVASNQRNWKRPVVEMLEDFLLLEFIIVDLLTRV